MDNPIDRLGDSADRMGEGIGGVLHTLARFLEQATGDVFTAAVVAIIIMFALYLLRGGASAKNTALYAYGLIILGIAGLVFTILFSFASIYSTDSAPSVPSVPHADNSSDEYAKALRQGFGQEPAPALVEEKPATPNLPAPAPSLIGTVYARAKWYLLVFMTMIFVGIMLTFLQLLIGKRSVRGSDNAS